MQGCNASVLPTRLTLEKKNQFLIQCHENFDQKTYTSPDARMLAPLGMVGAILRGALAGGGPAP